MSHFLIHADSSWSPTGVDEPVALLELDTRTVSNEPSTIKFEMNKEEVKNMLDTLEQIKNKFDETLS